MTQRWVIQTGEFSWLATPGAGLMRCVTGAILLAAAEQAFAHAWLIPFPHREAAVQILYPGSLVLLGLGLTFLIWGVLSEPRHPRAEPKIAPGSTRS